MCQVSNILFDCGFTIKKSDDYCDAPTFMVVTGDQEYNIQVIDFELNHEFAYMFKFKHYPRLDFVMKLEDIDSTVLKNKFREYVDLIRIKYAEQQTNYTKRITLDDFEDLCG